MLCVDQAFDHGVSLIWGYSSMCQLMYCLAPGECRSWRPNRESEQRKGETWEAFPGSADEPQLSADILIEGTEFKAMIDPEVTVIFISEKLKEITGKREVIRRLVKLENGSYQS